MGRMVWLCWLVLLYVFLLSCSICLFLLVRIFEVVFWLYLRVSLRWPMLLVSSVVMFFVMWCFYRFLGLFCCWLVISIWISLRIFCWLLLLVIVMCFRWVLWCSIRLVEFCLCLLFGGSFIWVFCWLFWWLWIGLMFGLNWWNGRCWRFRVLWWW